MINIKGKTLLFTDLHFMRRGFNLTKTQDLLEYMEHEILSCEIKNLIIMGDLFDSRKFLDILIFNQVNRFFVKLKENNISVIILTGNHDIYFKNTIKESSLDYLDLMFNNITIIKDTQFIKFNKSNLLLVPWICSSEDKNNPSESDIKTADMILGHFEFNNFELLPGVMSTHGLSSSRYQGTPTLSGHYHVRSKKGTIEYLGVCQQLNWSDFNTKKGYYILNEDLTKDFIENKTSEKYIKIFYVSSKDNLIRVVGEDIDSFLEYTDINTLIKDIDLDKRIIKVIIEDKTDTTNYNNFITTLDMNHIEYLLEDKTPEMVQLMNTNDSSLHNLDDLLPLLKSSISEEHHQMFNEIYMSAIELSQE